MKETAMDRTIILSQGGTNERTVSASTIKIPDLWHLAMHLKKGNALDRREAEKVLECWNLAHDLLGHIRKEA
jgi:hypothetical protein